MGSSPTSLSSNYSSIFTKECNTIHNTMKLRPSSSRRTPSFSTLSSSSSFSSFESLALYNADNNHPPSHMAPKIEFSGVPFSWEQLPGVPKKQVPNKKMESLMKKNNNLLPLPPTTTTPRSTKKIFDDIGIKTKKSTSNKSYHRDDPFFVALVECSKDNDQEEVNTSFWNGAKVSRSLSDRFGFLNLCTSSKRTCVVSESIIYLPRSTRNSYI